ncbi:MULTISPECIES: DUF2157 domain-containing protein [Dyadobacter]|uniref:DUF2157 domain-containing protein n=1 Tax=Dyadobacter chenhuakuii TaxID=2909339 RepID=A0ABY4XRU6_9BACT|nr:MULTISPECIES: DUF2157 domain-containing protein [Dyadobacter]MCE7070294.1 DUF2157 domain-containing protein [Dyadobacter sp. CY327]MCF2492593.1 DUF2157 domain-containing protein [Dyadobacter chenhuakuii]MCF2520390.1 DUF2157 domain-containing protein [Dyadobacter sp. CY351]USJ33112.1 DUF2157 domain-containing protein [Dyadobacter chenhuakuii]
MNTQTILKAFVEKAVISEEQASIIADYEQKKAFSLHWELRSILYLGIVLFSSGIGVIIYENIDTIGHQVIIASIAAFTAWCFYYTYKHALPYSNEKVSNPKKLADYILLLGCTTFLVLEGYLQFQYNIFGTRYGLAIIIPTLIFFFCAYRFDHKGALSMAITGLASWLGLTVAPLAVLSQNDFTDNRLLATAVILGSILCAFGWASEKRNIKHHFAFTYIFLGGNLAVLAALTGIFSDRAEFIYMLVGLALSVFFIQRARLTQSLIFLLIGVVYGYIILTHFIFSNIVSEDASFVFGTFYFAFTSIGVVFFLLNFKKFLGIKK